MRQIYKRRIGPSGHKAKGTPIGGDEVSWGFTGQHSCGYWYMMAQNQTFAEAMERAIADGHEKLPTPGE